MTVQNQLSALANATGDSDTAQCTYKCAWYVYIYNMGWWSGYGKY
jgi:hypothetical protein